MTTRIAAVVVTYNRSRILKKCVEYLRAQAVPSGAELDVLVVDNASTDNTVYVLTELIEDGVVQYFNTGKNLGGAGGFAFGMKVAVEAGYDLLWVMDDDCLPDADALDALLKAAAQLDEEAASKSHPTEASPEAASESPSETSGQKMPSWGFLSSVARWTDGSICAMNVQRHPVFSNIKDFSLDMQPASMASFVSLLVPAAVVREVGLPIAEFFIWTDDWEFTRRISRLHPSYVVGTSHVVHASATNNPGNIYTDPESRLDRYAYIYRNDGVLYRGEGLRGRLFLFVRAIYHSVRVLFANVEQKRRRLGYIWHGTKEGLSFNPPIQFPAE